MLIKFKCGNWQVEANSLCYVDSSFNLFHFYGIQLICIMHMTLWYKKMQESLAHPRSTSNVDQHTRYKLNNLSLIYSPSIFKMYGVLLLSKVKFL